MNMSIDFSFDNDYFLSQQSLSKIMSLKRIHREKGRTPSPSPITIYSNQIHNQKKSSVFMKGEQPFSSRRLSSKEQRSKSSKHKSKYRIITEPMEHFNKIQHLVNSNIFGNTSFARMPEREKDKNGTKNIQLSESKSKIKGVHSCVSCVKYKQTTEILNDKLVYYETEIQKMIEGLSGWRDGRITTDQFKANFTRTKIDKGRPKQSNIQTMKQLLQNVAGDIESLSKIDLVKMLKSEVFSYQSENDDEIGCKISEAKHLLLKLKGSMMSPNVVMKYNKHGNQQLMLRNLRARMNQLLRQNMELKIKLQIATEDGDESYLHSANLKMIAQNAISK